MIYKNEEKIMNYQSQLNQDAWVLEQTNNKRKGFFVEAGACDGKMLSNTYILEKEYHWHGICCEPNPEYHQALSENRNCHIEYDCLYSESGRQLEFSKTNELGGITQEFKNDGNEAELRRKRRLQSERCLVNTISLNDLLEKHNAPKNIDYISLDTEGSELSILSTFDFNKYNVRLWTIEHNHIILKELTDIFTNIGYDYSVKSFDCWFIKKIV